MIAIPLLLVDSNLAWLDLVSEVLGQQYDVHTADDLEGIGEPYPGGLYSLIFVVLRQPQRQLGQILNLSKLAMGRQRIVAVLPRHEESPEELRSIFLSGAYDFVDKPQSPRALRRMVEETLDRKYYRK